MSRVSGLFWGLTLGLAACAPEPGLRRQSLGAAHALFLDFGGASITAGSTDDAVAGVSALGAAVVPPFDASIVAPGVDPANVVDVLVDRVRTLYSPFDLDVVTTPPSGDYARILVGGTGAVLSPPAPAGSAGLATLDCSDTDARSVGFAFSDELSPRFGGPVALANAIAHEAGHGYGLEHLVEPTDPMYSVPVPMQTLADLFAQRFSVGAYSPFAAGGGSSPESCGRADPIDDQALLAAALGTRAPASAAPTVSVTFPPPLATLPTSVPLMIAASDDVAVTRVEVYRDLTLVAVLTSPPYALMLELQPAQATRITVEAVDAEAQRASTALQVAVDPAAPAPCDADHPCASAQSCVASVCVAPSSDGSVVPDAGGTPVTDEGCAFAPRRAPIDAAVLVLAVVALFVRRRARG